jgi:hypothetical protein
MPNLFRRFFLPAAASLLGAWGLSACGHALPNIPHFNAAAWRADPYGCQNQRGPELPTLLQHKETLYEARADDVTALLGHPDEEELRANTEKVYYYYLESGTQCDAKHIRSTAAKLSLRFGPLGTVTEVLADAVAK